MSGLLGKKIGMTSIYDQNGKRVAVTVIEAGPCIVTQIKTKANDGYDAIQLAFDDIDERKVTKPLLGHFKKTNTQPKRILKEFTRFEEGFQKQLGEVLTPDKIFVEGEYIDVSGITKGKGFQGVVKRHGFSGVGMGTHGQKDRQRHAGSIGASSYPPRVMKGTKMPGRDGGKKVKMINLQIMKIIPEKNLVLVKGAVPGHVGSYLKLERWK